IYTATPSTLIALDLSTGEALWKFSGKRDFNKSPFIMGKEIFAVDIEGRLYAVDVHTGQNRWNFVFGDAAASEPVGVQGVIYVTSVDGTLYAIE
ncbi:PQQ-like beta-propeller repeat protein, partial [Dehalococcoidia bacterium]|nr:PQQ-like beta-propeller repeat protein [Dehalococcoidia bacterium]